MPDNNSHKNVRKNTQKALEQNPLPKRLQQGLTHTQQLLEQYDVQQYLLENQHAWLLSRAGLQPSAQVGGIATVEISTYQPIAATDQLVLWLNTPANGGVYALAEVVGEVIERASPLLTQRIWVIHYRYTYILAEPQGSFNAPVLQTLTALAAHNTAVRLDVDVWSALYADLLDDTVTTDIQEAETTDNTVSPLSLTAIYAELTARQLRIGAQDLRRYHLALQIRGFVLLTGISGVGKTWLAESYAQIVGANWLTVPVASNWTSSEDLLGFYNPLSQQFQSTALTEFLRQAAADYQHLGNTASAFHVILDEMNLARVEHYFAPFLATLEQRQRYGQATVSLTTQQQLLLTPNVYFIGTVNIDETTHHFADKVFDRAQVIELTIDKNQLAEHIADLPYADLLLAIWDTMHIVAPFGFRIVDEIRTYIEAAAALDISWQQALDEQLVQKILPKLRSVQMETVLAELLSITEQHELRLSAEKIQALQRVFKDYY